MRRNHFINKLRELGYKFRRDAWRVTIWHHPHKHHEIHVRKKDLLDDEWVRATLKYAGCSEEERESFIASCVALRAQ